MFEQFPRCTRREPGLPSPDKLGYLPFQARAQLAEYTPSSCSARGTPVPFFGYPGESARLVAENARVVDPAEGGRDVHAVLAALCDSVGARRTRSGRRAHPADDPTGPLQPQSICQAIARSCRKTRSWWIEGITSSLALYPALTGALPHDYIACKAAPSGTARRWQRVRPSRPRAVACSRTWGRSALYTLQSL